MKAFALAVLVLLAAGPVSAQESPAPAAAAAQPAAPASEKRLAIELNDVTTGAGACKAVFVINNGLGAPITKLTLRLVAFSKQGGALRFVALDAGAMPERKTRVLSFPLVDKPCEDVGRVVLDDVPACEGEGLNPALCLKAVAVSSRTGLELVY